MSNLDKDIEILKEMKENLSYETQCITGGEDYTRQVLAIENVLSELETYKKIAEKLAEYIETKNYANDICEFRLDVKGRFHKHCYKGECKQCIIDWARNEVEKDE